MALLADIDDSYTKTGKGTLARWSDKLSYIPFIGGAIAWPLGMLSTFIETAQYLFRGQFGSAITALAAGTVGSIANGLSGMTSPLGIAANIGKGVIWWGNAASGLTTGATLGAHARAATEAVIGAVTRPLGMEPQVLKSYQAGIGSINGGQMQSGPGKFFSEAARSKGESPDAAYARMQAGQADHMAALEAARAQGTSAYKGA